MHIDICGGTDRTMTKPCLDVFQTDTAGKKQCSTTVPKIMKPDAPHIVLLKQLGEMCG